MKKLNLIIPALLIAIQFNAYTQCENCDPRSVALYDIKVDVDVPPAGATNEINIYIKMLEITGHALAYFVVQDPLAYCNNIINVVSAYPADSSNYEALAEMQTEPVNTSEQDYYIWGTVSGSSGSYTAEAKIAVGKTHEIIKTATYSFGDDFNPQTVAYQLGGGLGSIYATIMEFEKEKRDGGEPYATTPRIVLKPEKNKVDFNESTPVYITATDCDGEPLKNRHLHLTVVGGILDSENVITDDQGTSFVMFTAGTIPKIAIVHSEYAYTIPPESNRICSAEPAVIQIKKPDDAWYVQGKYKVTTRLNSNDDGSIPGVMSFTQLSHSFTTREIFYAAWVKRQPIPYHPLEFATTTDDPIDIKYKAIETEVTGGKEHSQTVISCTIKQDYISSTTQDIPSGDYKLYLAIGSSSYGFGLTLIDSHRTGYAFSMEDKWDPIEGHTHTDGYLDIDEDTHLGLNVQGAKCDTTYTNVETNPALGESETTTVTQTFSWNNEKCKLNYSSLYEYNQHHNLFGTEINYTKVQTKEVNFWMAYNGEAPSGIEENITLPDGYLYQNNPNPCSSVTWIGYSISSAQHVTLKIFDVYGSEIDMLIDEVQQSGLHKVYYDVSCLPAGAYFCHFRSGNTVQLKKIIVAR